MKRFGEKLLILRKRQQLTQRQLGTALGIDYSYIGKMERGENVPSMAMLLKIANFFGVSPNQLILDDSDLDLS